MNSTFNIRPIETDDIPLLTDWARLEGFSPGTGDVTVYKNTDNQGIWVGCLGNKPIGCIAGIKYNSSYGFIGLFIVLKNKDLSRFKASITSESARFATNLNTLLKSISDFIADFRIEPPARPIKDAAVTALVLFKSLPAVFTIFPDAPTKGIRYVLA